MLTTLITTPTLSDPMAVMASSSSSSFLPLLSLTFLLLATPTFSQAGRRLRGPTARGHNATAPFLIPHNKARKVVSVPLLSWSTNLTRTASLFARYQRDHSRCGFAALSSSSYGANQALANYPITPAEVVASWVAEKKWYTYDNNTCAAGHECGTYTQVVWRNTSEVGCAQAVCPGGDTITICLYWPHGNVIGEKPF